MAVKHLTVENFEDEVLKQEQPVLVDFWAPWCGPCKMLSPIVDELAEELTQVKICKVNIDEQIELAEKYRVMTIPTLLVFNEGNLTNTSIGVKPKSDILKMLSIV
jgi:thioredoxin 1